MPEPSLEQVFGRDSSQTDTQLLISKSSLADVGLEVKEENTAESLIAAILIKASSHLNVLNQEADSDIQITINREEDNYIFRDEE